MRGPSEVWLIPSAEAESPGRQVATSGESAWNCGRLVEAGGVEPTLSGVALAGAMMAVAFGLTGRDTIVEARCDDGRGFLYARPMVSGEVAMLLGSREG